MFKLDLEKAEEPENKLPTSLIKQESSIKTSTSASLTTLKSLIVWIIRHRTTDWFKIRKGVHQGCILSPCLLNLSAECIMQNAGLDEAQAEIKPQIRR